MNSASSPIRRRKLSHDVEERLLAVVEDGSLKPGDPLPSERELMEAYKVGRPAIREAMQNLERMGLVEIRHGERPRVAAPSMDEIFGRLGKTVRHLLSHSEQNLGHLKDARALFEIEMVRIAARQRTADDLASIKAIIADQAQATNNQREFLACDGRFHAAIARTSGNPIFVSLCEAMFEWLAHFHVDLVSVPGLEALTLDEHRQILAAIEQKDPEAAATAMHDHLYRANRLYHQKHLQAKQTVGEHWAENE